MVDWGYFNRFEELTDKYLPDMGEGETMATQIVTAVCKLVYKWYNDGDVYDNTGLLDGWCNDLSSYANWLDQNAGAEYLYGIFDCGNGGEYEDILKELADDLLDADKLEKWNAQPAKGSIYNCKGDFQFVDQYEDDEDDDWY